MSILRWLRLAGIIEGLSWLTLLFIAMPLKYLWGEPEAVQVVGATHGALFVAFMGLLTISHVACRWPIARSAALFASALLPFGFLWIDDRLKREIEKAEPS